MYNDFSNLYVCIVPFGRFDHYYFINRTASIFSNQKVQKNNPNNGYTSLVAKTKVKKSMGVVGVFKNQGSESKFHGTVA